MPTLDSREAKGPYCWSGSEPREEAFPEPVAEFPPIAVGEAMACGVPCVVTEVGDSPILVGETGVVVPLRDPQALADGWNLMLTRLATEGPELRAKARCRIVQEFDRDRLAARTSQVLGSLL